MILLKKKNNRR